jgi:hypothetical protein
LDHVSDEPIDVPKRADIPRIRADIARRRVTGYDFLIIPIVDVEALIIESELYRLHEERRRQRRPDAAQARQSVRKPPPHITVEDLDEWDEP